MASAYASRLTVPDAFPPILKEFSREALRDYPRDQEPADQEEWVLQYAVEYFRRQKEVSGSVAAATRDVLSAEELERRITAIFGQADHDENGRLDHREFKHVVVAFAEELGLPLQDTRRLLAEADENEDGCVDYREFVPMAVDVIEAIYARHRYGEERASRAAASAEQTRHYLLHGMPRQQLEESLRAEFAKADADGSGALSRAEFVSALRNSSLGLTRKEVNVLLAEADTDANGCVDYHEFLPMCFNLLVESVSRQFEDSDIPAEEAELRDFLLKYFEASDPDQNGFISREAVMVAMREADIGLSLVQLHALMADAVENEDGLVDYRQFAGMAGGVIAAILSVQMSPEMSARLEEARSQESMQSINGMDREAFEGKLIQVLQSVDGEGAGRAPEAAVAEQLAAEMGLGERQVRALVGLGFDGAEDRTVALQPIVDLAFEAALQTEEQRFIVSDLTA